VACYSYHKNDQYITSMWLAPYQKLSLYHLHAKTDFPLSVS